MFGTNVPNPQTTGQTANTQPVVQPPRQNPPPVNQPTRPAENNFADIWSAGTGGTGQTGTGANRPGQQVPPINQPTNPNNPNNPRNPPPPPQNPPAGRTTTFNQLFGLGGK